MQYPRAVNLENGTAMVVTDLHGEGEIYATIRHKFMEMRRAGTVDKLIICGDLIHGYRAADHDYSLNMLLNLMKLRQDIGEDKVIMLLGNHEMPHIYNVTLSKGNMEFTARFEQALSQSGRRDDVFDFLCSLPFYVFTKAGVVLTHAGASHVIIDAEEAERALTFDHRALLKLADDQLRNGFDLERLQKDQAYIQQARYFIGISGAEDERLHHLLRGQLLSQRNEEFSFLWDLLFTRNEQGSSLGAYMHLVDVFLDALSQVAPYEQRVVVAGHIGVRGGHKNMGDKQLRLASYSHASPHDDGQYLLLDCEQAVQTASDLVPHLRHTLD